MMKKLTGVTSAAGGALFLASCVTYPYESAFQRCDNAAAQCYRGCEQYEGDSSGSRCRSDCEYSADRCFDSAYEPYRSGYAYGGYGYGGGYSSPWYGQWGYWQPGAGYYYSYPRGAPYYYHKPARPRPDYYGRRPGTDRPGYKATPPSGQPRVAPPPQSAPPTQPSQPTYSAPPQQQQPPPTYSAPPPTYSPPPQQPRDKRPPPGDRPNPPRGPRDEGERQPN
jgi:hypothetical protein